MALNLTIDQGNSRAKIALWQAGTNTCVSELRVQGLDGAALREVLRDVQVHTAIYCSVSQRPTHIIHWIKNHCERFVDLTSTAPLPITLGYATPETLGVDRIAAAVGAYTLAGCRGRNLLVADIGTAITYDHVTASGCFVGGNIAPGIFMRLQALNHYTARLPLVETDGDVSLWGNSTESALRAGAINGVIAELAYYRSRLDKPVVVITGGAAQLVIDRLPFEHIFVPNLVSYGLNSIINYNENK